MKTKTIPFDLETAKKIQAGEIEGKIKTKNGVEVYKMCLTQSRQSKSGCMPFSYFVLEVPDNESQLQVGDIVRVRPNNTHSHFVKQYDNCIGKIVGKHNEYYVVIVTGAFQGQFLVAELEFVAKTAKHEFKPFDKVLVRKDQNDDGDPDTWVISYFMDESIAGYRVLNGEWFDQCIQYEGNEHLLGTTDKPKEE